MNTTGEGTLAISKEVLLQCMRDGRAYKELVQRMATIIYHEMKSDGKEDAMTVVLYGDIQDMGDPGLRREVELVSKGTDLPIYATSEGPIVSVLGHQVYSTNFKRWSFGE